MKDSQVGLGLREQWKWSWKRHWRRSAL